MASAGALPAQAGLPTPRDLVPPPSLGGPSPEPPLEQASLPKPPLSPPSPRCSPPGGCTPHPAAALPAPAHRSQIWTWHLTAPNFQQKPPVPSCGCRPHCSRAAGRIQPCEKGRKGFGVACCLAPSCSGDGEQLPLPRHTAWGHGYPPQGSPTGSRDMRQLLQHSHQEPSQNPWGKSPAPSPRAARALPKRSRDLQVPPESVLLFKDNIQLPAHGHIVSGSFLPQKRGSGGIGAGKKSLPSPCSKSRRAAPQPAPS